VAAIIRTFVACHFVESASAPTMLSGQANVDELLLAQTNKWSPDQGKKFKIQLDIFNLD
jgi:hypothetical protein